MSEFVLIALAKSALATVETDREITDPAEIREWAENLVESMLPAAQPTTPADSPVISEDEYTALAAISEENYRRWYMELIYSVQSKFDGETRHETALRYIKQAESTCYGPEVASDE